MESLIETQLKINNCIKCGSTGVHVAYNISIYAQNPPYMCLCPDCYATSGSRITIEEAVEEWNKVNPPSKSMQRRIKIQKGEGNEG